MKKRRLTSTIVTTILALLALGLTAAMATEPPEPSLVSVSTGEDYERVTLTFSTDVFRLDAEGVPVDEDPPLHPDDFVLIGAGAVTISDVEQGDTLETWTLELSGSVVPHLTAVDVIEGAIGNTTGPVDLDEPVAVPFTAAHLAAFATSLLALELVPADVAVLPFVEDWLERAHELRDLLAGLEELPTDVEEELVEYLEGLDAVSADEALRELLESLPAVEVVSFDGFDVAVEFNESGVASTQTMSGPVGVGEADGEVLELTLESELDVDIHLGGALDISVGDTVDIALDDEALPTVHLVVAATFSPSGRLGVVDISSEAQATLDAVFTVASLDPLELDLSGDAALDVTEVSIADPPFGPETLPTLSGAPLISVGWPDVADLLGCEEGSLEDLDGILLCVIEVESDDVVCPDGSSPLAAGDDEDDGFVCRTAPIDNVELELDLDQFDPRNFARITVDDLVGGITWFGTWLIEVQQHDLLGAELPILGDAVGDLARVADTLARPAVALSDVATVVGAVRETGDISAQELQDVCAISASDLDDVIDDFAAELEIDPDVAEVDGEPTLRERLQNARETCAGLLDDAQMLITHDAIEYTVTVEVDRDLFPDGPPSLDLALGDDLAGISLSSTSGDWSGSATASFELTVGMKLAADDDLGIGPEDSQFGSRFYVRSGEIADVAADIGTGEGDVVFAARLGFLDVNAVGTVAFDPAVAISLVDPGSGLVTLQELAAAADDGEVSDVVSLVVDGDVSAAFALHNELIFATPRTLTVEGPVAALGNSSGQIFAFHSHIDTERFAADRINVGHDLDEALNLKTVTPAQVIQMIAGLADGIVEMASSEAMAITIPFVDVRFQEAVGFARDIRDVADRVAARDPRDISALQAALDDALAAAGMPSLVVVGLTGEEFTLEFDVEKSVTRTYPFSFEGGGLNFAPADGGASMTAEAAVALDGEFGMLFGDGDLTERVFLRSEGIHFTLGVDANVFGDVYLGPVKAGIEGSAAIGGDDPASLSIELVGDRITLDDLATPDEVIDVTVGGPIAADLGISTALGAGTLVVGGDLADLGGLTVNSHLDFDLALDLETLVFGTLELSRFVGRLLEQSEVVTANLPLIGDEIAALSDVGGDLQGAALALQDAFEDATDDQEFLDALVDELIGELCPDEDCVELDMGGAEELATAQQVEVTLTLDESTSADRPLGSGIDLGPVFSFGFEIEPEVEFGYSLDIVLGLSIDDGFYVRATDDGGDVLQLFAGFSADVDADATLLGVIDAAITGGTASIGGSMGENDAGGFAIALDEQLSLRTLSNRQRSVDEVVSARLEAEIKAKLPVRTEMLSLVALEFPINAHVDVTGGRPQTVVALGCHPDVLPDVCDSSEPIFLDASTFVDAVVTPVFGQLQEYNPLASHGPLSPVRDVLETNVPILSHPEAAEDEDELQIRDLIGFLAGDDPQWAIVEFLLDLDQVDLELESSGRIDFGWIQVTPDFQRHAPGTPVSEQEGAESLFFLIDTIQELMGIAGSFGTASTGDDAFSAASTSNDVVRFPILDDPASLLLLLVGGEHGGVVTFIEIDIPRITVGPSISYEATLFDLDIAFIDAYLAVALLGELGLTVDIGFGYDSVGLQTGNALHGFYLMDKDGPEIGLGGRVEATVDGRFGVLGDTFSVNFKGSGGVRLQGGLDLFDNATALPEPGRGDGRLHLHEIGIIASAYESPVPGVDELSFLCMFQLEVLFDAHLSFSGRLKVLRKTVFKRSFSDSWEFVNETISCSIIEKAAHIDGRRLVLNGGTFADMRFDGDGDLAEVFEIRPGSGAGEVDVTVTTYALDDEDKTSPLNTITTTFDLGDFDEIYAELGQGDDEVEIDLAITKPAIINGGPGDDTLLGGGGGDLLDGGSGNNELRGRAGTNTLIGGGGDDKLWTGSGDDVLRGGGGANTYIIGEDGWGTAVVDDAAANATLDFRTSEPLVGTATFFDGTITAGSSSVLEYQLDEVTTILGGDGDDEFELNRYAPDGFLIDGRGGEDEITVRFSGVDRTINVVDSGGGATLFAHGTAGNDTILFRGNRDVGDEDPAERGFVALKTPTDAVDRVNYDDGIALLHVHGTAGANTFVLDDTAAPLEIDGGDGGSTFQVGQVFGNDRTSPDFVGEGDETRTDDVTVGRITMGVSHEATLRGGAGDDTFTVFRNIAPLTLEGISGNNTFILRAFIQADVNAFGGDGDDRFEYVVNDHISIDGGDGFNTLVAVGTEEDDGFVLDGDSLEMCPQYEPHEIPEWAPVDRLPNPDAEGCAFDVDFVNIQQIIFHGLHGNNAFWVRSTTPDAAVRLFGGLDGATFLVGDEEGVLTGIEGPVHIDGLADPELDVSLPVPVVLPGEDATPGEFPDAPEDVDQENILVVTAAAHDDDGAGTLTEGRIFGLGMGDGVEIDTPDGGSETFPGGVTYETIDEVTVILGQGDDAFTVESTHTYLEAEDEVLTPEQALMLGAAEGGTVVRATTTIVAGSGDDDIAIRSIDGPTTVDARSGANVVRAGSDVAPGASHPDGASTLGGISQTLHVVGDGEDDNVILDVSGTEVGDDGLGERVDVDQGRVTQLSMPGEVTHEDLGMLEIFLTDGADVANARGTSAGTSVLHGLDADDRFFVSDAAEYEVGDETPEFLPGTLDDISGDVDVRGGDDTNLLMVSDRDSTTPIVGAVLDADRMEGFADGTVFYEASGTFAGGITVWTGSDGDEIGVAGTRSDGDPTTLAWGDDEGGDDPRTITTLNTGDGDDTVQVSIEESHGFFVLNTGPGDDTVDGGASSVGIVVFGGEGNDTITTGSGDDIVFGDEGRVEYCDGEGVVTDDSQPGVSDCGDDIVTLLGDPDQANLNDGLARRPTRIYSTNMTTAGELDGDPYGPWTDGFNNRIDVGGGDDIAWGGPGSDLLTASDGENALIGDHAEVWRFTPGELGGPRTVTSQTPFIDDEVLGGDIAYVVDVTHPNVGEGDLILGGSGDDWIFAGPGDDIVVGGPGNDIVWGGDGHDIIWGDVGDDRIYGGNGDNVIDVKLSSFEAGLTTSIDDGAWWDLAWYIAPQGDTDGDVATDNGSDIVYGGRGRDIMQADLGAGGPTPGDRLMDWYGSFNLYLVCEGPYGAGRILREPSPNIVEVLLRLAEADGAYDVRVTGSSGWEQLALAVDEHARPNRGSAHPDHPGNAAGC